MQAFHVKIHPGGWHICYDDRQFGPYDNCRSATGAAIDAARQAEELNLSTYVVVHDEDGAEDIVWPEGAH